MMMIGPHRLFSTGSGGMKVFDSVTGYRAFRRSFSPTDAIAFVPTMGCLHEGHLHLISIAKKLAPTVVSSIFVNPSQFAPHEDLNSYPKTLEQDLKNLRRAGCDAVLVPKVSEMYPSGITLDVSKQQGAFVSVDGFSHQLEGKVRPHFFRGVATVVTKLLNIVEPSHLVLGQKDAQQCVVLRRMVKDLCFNIDVVVGETQREHDGLAMSSRNRYLSPDERKRASVLYRALMKGKEFYMHGETSSAKLKHVMERVIKEEPAAQLEYLSFADPLTLAELDTIAETGAILSGAIRLGKTRLIDNLLLNCQL